MQEEKLKIIHIIPNLQKGGAERLVQDICNYIFQNQLAHIKLITFHKDIKVKSTFHVNIPSQFELSITNKSKIHVVELQRFIENFKPDIIHSHLWESEMLLTNIKFKNCLRFSHFHDNMVQLRKSFFPKNKSHLTNIYEKKLYLKNNNNHFICIAKDSFNFALKSLPKKNKIHLIHNAVNYQKFHNNKRRNLNQIRIINIGSFVEKKNQSFAIHILKDILDKGYSADLTYLGDGKLIEDVKKLSEALGVQKFVYFLGNVENVEEHLLRSNIYLHTAIYEPFGLVILEAMAAGLPVITLDGSGNRDIIKHEKNGFIFKKQDPKIFVEKIIELSKNEKLYSQMVKKGKETAKNFDISNYVEKLLQTYKQSILNKT